VKGARAVSGVSAVPRNAAWLFIGRIVGQALAVVMTVLLAARLGLVGLGQYAFISAVVFLANVATTFGTDMVLIREIAGAGRVNRWSAALAVQLGLSGLAVGLIWLAAPLLPGQPREVVSALRVLSLSLVPAALFSVCTAVMRGLGMMRAHAAVGVAAAAIQLGAMAAFVRPGASVGRAAGTLLMAQVVLALVAWAAGAARIRELRKVPRASSSEIGEMARTSASVGVLGLLGVVYQRLGAIAVALMVGPAATGWFAGASRIVDASKTGHLALFGAVYPAMAENRGNQQPTARDRLSASTLAWSWRLCVALGGLVSAGLLVLGPLLIGRLYGPAFGPSKNALAILALTVVPCTMATYQSLALLAAHREHVTLLVLATSVTVLVVLMAVLIPTIGWLGACWAVLAADTVQAVLMLLARSVDRPFVVRRFRPVPSAASAIESSFG
jgi:O-antigen/teichoic acid export membrane protein